MAKTITLTNTQWDILKGKIAEDYGRTTVMISWRLKDTLGFTVRTHISKANEFEDWSNRYSIRLDFWDEMLYIMFLLKYSDYLDPSVKVNQ